MSPASAHPPFTYPLELVDGFDPYPLPDATPPLPDVRSWRWLADPDRTDEEVRAYLKRFVGGFGTTDPSYMDLRLDPRSRDEVIAGHLEQQVVLDFPGGVRARLQSAATAPDGTDAALPTQPTEQAEQAAGPDAASWRPAPAEFPFTNPVAIIGTSVPAASASEAVGVVVADVLSDFLTGWGAECWPAVAADPGREWVDPVVMTSAAEFTGVAMAAASHWQPFMTLWRPDEDHPFGALDVIALTEPDWGTVVATAPADLHRLSVSPCPLIPGAGHGDLCQQHGGPWVSRSITAARRWEERRARMIRALGCDTCGNGAIKIFQGSVRSGRRQAIPVRPHTSGPTRHDRLVLTDPDAQR